MYVKCLSAKRSAGGTPANFELPFQTTLTEGKYKLVQAVIGSNFYTANVKNNMVYWTENGAAKSVAITPGYYNIISFAAQVATQMTTVSAGYNTYTSSVGAATQLVTLSAANAFFLTFGTNTLNSAAGLLGVAAVDQTGALTQTGTLIPNMNPTLSFNIGIQSGSGTATGIRDSTGSQYAFIVPMMGNSQSIITYTPPADFSQYLTLAAPTRALTITLTDDLNNILLGMLDWYMILEQL